MIESKNVGQTRLYLDAANYHYQQMECNLQDRRKFLYSLLAFLPIARSITLVFKEETNKDRQLQAWYQEKVTGWQNNKLMKFFTELRNISIHEHTPDTRTRVAVVWTANVSLTEKDVRKVVDSDGKERWFTPLLPLEVKSEEVIGYHFVHNSEWFNEIPDVVNLCKKYLDELENFVLEAEHISENKGV
jgi:hypothetical protein